MTLDTKIKDINRKLKEKEHTNNTIVDSVDRLHTTTDNIKSLIETGSYKNEIKDIYNAIKNIKLQPNIKVDMSALDNIKKLLEALINISNEQKLSQKDPISVNWPKKPSEAIPVVLTNKDKDEFYNALMTAISGGSIDTSKLSTSLLQQQILTAISDLETAINNIEINADTINLNTDDLEDKLDTLISKADPLAKYKFSDLDDDATPNYYGAIDTEGNWYILKEDTTAKTLRYVTGNSNYSANWTNRALLSYDYLFNVTVY